MKRLGLFLASAWLAMSPIARSGVYSRGYYGYASGRKFGGSDFHRGWQ